MNDHKNNPSATRSGRSQSGVSGPMLIRFGVFDPAPDGHELSCAACEQVLEDLSCIADFAVVEPMAVAVFRDEPGSVRVRQLRFALYVAGDQLCMVLGHLREYAALCLPGHPVLIEIAGVEWVA